MHRKKKNQDFQKKNVEQRRWPEGENPVRAKEGRAKKRRPARKKKKQSAWEGPHALCKAGGKKDGVV